MPIYSPTGFLDITNATLRTSNLETQNLKINGGNITVTTEFTVLHAPASNTVQFSNVTTGLVATANIDVGGELTVSGNVEVGGNVVVTGNVVAGYLYGDGSNISGISSNLDQIVNIGNVTSNTIQFTNPATSLVASGNVEVGGDVVLSGNATVSSNLTVSGNATMTQQLKVDDTLRLSDGSSDPLNFVDMSLQVVSSFVWLQEQKLTAGDISGNSDYFGWSVAIDGDGDTVILGRPRSYLGGNFGVGAAYIFTRSGTTWTQQQKLLHGDPASLDYLGHSVSISKDGNTVAVGAYNKTIGSAASAGAVYVFVRPPGGTTWTQQQRLTSNNPLFIDYLGSSVCISGDGNTVVAGGYYERRNLPATTNVGCAFVWGRSPGGTTWTQQQELLPNPALTIAAHFGWSV